MKSRLQEPVTNLAGIGKVRAEKLQKLNITTIKDFFYHFPRDYIDRRNVKPIAQARPGKKITAQVTVKDVETSRTRNNTSITKIKFQDVKSKETEIQGVWFNQPYRANYFQEGQVYCISGKIDENSWQKYSKLQVINPVYEKWSVKPAIHTRRIVPIYPLTAGINQLQFRELVFAVISKYSNYLEDWLPEDLKKKYSYPEFSSSIKEVHFPSNRKDFQKARSSLAFSELFLLQLKLQLKKEKLNRKKGVSLAVRPAITAKFLENLDFSLTVSQKKVWQEIANDLEKKIPMRRLLQGDVGSGKTIIAALAILTAISNGRPALYLVPTEILAEQQLLKLQKLFASFPFKLDILTGGITAEEKEEILQDLNSGRIDLLLGTHALFQGDFSLEKSGLIIIDEQHRFGVHQREKMIMTGNKSDLLVMTATPIPRTMALTLYGDLAISTIEELPPGRKPVKTFLRSPEDRDNIYAYLRKRVTGDERAFIVCPAIEPSKEMAGVISCQEVYDYLEANFFSSRQIALLTGQISSERREKIMAKFKQGEIKVIVATSVIEVGVDIPEATMMVIENADRFGLAQLHQLRGRVGRSSRTSLCVLVADSPTAEGKERLIALKSHHDGFKIAERDLEIRGPGEFFGAAQHGLPHLKIADLSKDLRLLQQAQKEAQKLITSKKGVGYLPLKILAEDELELII